MEEEISDVVRATLIIKGLMNKMSGIEINELVWSIFPDISPDDREHAWDNAQKTSFLVDRKVIP